MIDVVFALVSLDVTMYPNLDKALARLTTAVPFTLEELAADLLPAWCAPVFDRQFWYTDEGVKLAQAFWTFYRHEAIGIVRAARVLFNRPLPKQLKMRHFD